MYTEGEQELRDLIIDTLFHCGVGAKSAPMADTLMAIPKVKASSDMYNALNYVLVDDNVEKLHPAILRSIIEARDKARGE